MGVAWSFYGGETRYIQGFCWGNLRERVHLEDPGVDGIAILRWLFRRWDVGTWTGLIWIRIRTDVGHL